MPNAMKINTATSQATVFWVVFKEGTLVFGFARTLIRASFGETAFALAKAHKVAMTKA